MVTLVIATRNAHKVGEIRAILGDRFRVLSLEDFPGAPEAVEDAATFAGNATKKSVALAEWLSREPHPGLCDSPIRVMADDSGLEVDALNGAPGVHSARFAALDTGRPGNSSTADNNAKLLRLMADVPPEKRSARFRCVLALTHVPGPEPGNPSDGCQGRESQLRTELFEGTCEGRIGLAPSGQGGFGYDSLFAPAGSDRTFGELDHTVKNRLSHRARALELLRSRLIGVD